MFSPMYSSSFILLDFTFRPLIHFVLIFFFFHNHSVSICWKVYLFFIELHLHLYWKSIDHICVLMDSLVCSLDLFGYLYATTRVSWWLTFYNNSWNHIILVLQLWLFSYVQHLFSQLYFTPFSSFWPSFSGVTNSNTHNLKTVFILTAFSLCISISNFY